MSVKSATWKGNLLLISVGLILLILSPIIFVAAVFERLRTGSWK